MRERSEAEVSKVDPKQWLIDVAADYVFHRPSGLGFHIDFLPADFVAEFCGVGNFVAMAIPLRMRSEISPRDASELAQQAAQLYVRVLRKKLEHETEQSSRGPNHGSEQT